MPPTAATIPPRVVASPVLTDEQVRVYAAIRTVTNTTGEPATVADLCDGLSRDRARIAAALVTLTAHGFVSAAQSSGDTTYVTVTE